MHLGFDEDDEAYLRGADRVDLDALPERQAGEILRLLKRVADVAAQRSGGFGALRPRQPHRLDALVDAALDAATVGGDRGRNTTGVRAWFAFCQEKMGISPERILEPSASLREMLDEEWLAMQFVCALVEERGVLPETAAKYFSQVQGWHARCFGIKIGGGLKLERLPQMVKGLRRLTPETKPRMVRRGVSPQMLAAAFDAYGLDPLVPAHANVRAALSVALQGLLRSAEFSGKRTHLTLLRSDLVHIDAQQLTLMMHPCKNMKHINGKTCPLLIGAGGSFVDAVAEVRNLLAVDPAGSDAPLFRDPYTNEPLSYEFILAITRDLMRAIGEEPAHFGAHSYRIGGATALFAAGASDTVIRTMGRWSSDIHRLYVRACFEQCLDWSRRAGSTATREVAADYAEVDDY